MLKTSLDGAMPRLLRSGLQSKSMGGRGAGTPAPQLRLAPSKFGAGKFCRFKEQKRKISRESRIL